MLVAGGRDFLSYPVVRALLEETSRDTIYVMSRHPNQKLPDYVNYRSIDLTNADAIDALFEEIRPRVIIHTVSPRASDFSVKDPEFGTTNVEGNQNLLWTAARVNTVRAFVYSSPVNIALRSPDMNLSESAPY
ncbi:hypothetical protein MMC28_003686 [Mycoblastus sanguinarius]|nr:hypothetical protein [Mycoblastus sanguinarius]